MPRIFDDIVSIILGWIVILLSLATASSSTTITVDNTSPQVVYSPTPCYEDTPTACSIEWVLVELPRAFNGSVTSTNGPLPDPSDIDISIIPRVTFNFTGSGISFFPGPNSTANVSVTLDDRPSFIIDTSKQSFQAMQLGGRNDSSHTLVIEYDSTQTESNVLEVDCFHVVQDEIINTSLSSLPFTPTLVSTSAIMAFTSFQTSQPTTGSLLVIGSKNRPSTGTIIAIAIFASGLLLATLLTWVWSAKCRGRRMAIKRENAILTGMKMPSEGNDVVRIWPGGVTIHTWKKKDGQASKSWWT